MEGLAQELIPFLQYLLPGFVTSWLFYALTSYQRPGQFEQIVQALIFTFLIQVGVTLIKYFCFWVGEVWWVVGVWDKTAEPVWAVIMAVLLGLGFSYFANTDKLHAVLRKVGVTRETSYPSEWYNSFLSNESYIVLHLRDERRMMGWPREWPSSPIKGQFVLELPAWLAEDGAHLPLQGAAYFVIDVKEVFWVEFLKGDTAYVEQTTDTIAV
jgi:hypothetical protein